MSELLAVSESTQYLAAVIGAGAVGATFGMAMERRAIKNIAADRQPITPVYSEVSQAIRVSRTKRAAATVVSTLCAVGFSAGLFNGSVWAELPGGETSPAHVTVLVDKGLEVGVPQTYDTLTNKVLAGFQSETATDTSTVVAMLNKAEPTTIEQAIATDPYGTANKLDDMTEAALKQAELQNHKIVAGSLEDHQAVVVITNNTSIGEKGSVIAEAKAAHLPVEIVNVASHEISPSKDPVAAKQTTEDLKTIAAETGGHYWDVDSKDLSDVAKQTTSRLVPGITKAGWSMPARWPLRALAAIGTVWGLGVAYSQRKKSALYREEVTSKDMKLIEEVL